MRVKIIDEKHPHYGEYGELTNEVAQIAGAELLMGKMLKLILESCSHGVEGCFVSEGQVAEAKEYGR